MAMPRTKNRTLLADDWKPSEHVWAWAVEYLKPYGLDPAVEFEKFQDHHKAHGSLMASWDAAFRTWIRNAPRFAPTPRPGAGNGHADVAPEKREKLARWYESRGMHVPMRLRH